MKNLVPGLCLILCLGISSAYAANESDKAGTNPAELESLESRAAAGNEKAQMKLAAMYLQGNGVTADVQKAVWYYHQAAEQDIAFAQHKLARLYLDGNFVAQDPVQAMDWLLRAARLGFVQAQLDLSRLYETGSFETPQDLIQAYKWLSIAASLTEQDLTANQEALEAKMTFTESARAKVLSGVCIINGYQDC